MIVARRAARVAGLKAFSLFAVMRCLKASPTQISCVIRSFSEVAKALGSVLTDAVVDSNVFSEAKDYGHSDEWE